ncbi:MAG: 3-methyl-2-oxobutanoate hydroxymethyltransferase, partial [Thermoproteota archaeon]|nr:3-methyl-2-oxobutanoate hydroxymethyltransferase [Thermoproteota archaeon]
GQVLVLHDLLGLYDVIKPKFAKRYAESYSLFSTAITNYISDVKSGGFPDPQHSFSMSKEELQNFENYLSSLKACKKGDGEK